MFLIVFKEEEKNQQVFIKDTTMRREITFGSHNGPKGGKGSKGGSRGEVGRMKKGRGFQSRDSSRAISQAQLYHHSSTYSKQKGRLKTICGKCSMGIRNVYVATRYEHLRKCWTLDRQQHLELSSGDCRSFVHKQNI